MQNFPNNIVPTSLYCNKYYTRCAAACQCASDGRSLTGQSTVPSTRVWRITSATRKTLWRLRVAATPSSATMGPRERSSGHHFCGGAAETDGTVHRSLSCTSDINGCPRTPTTRSPQASMWSCIATPAGLRTAPRTRTTTARSGSRWKRSKAHSPAKLTVLPYCFKQNPPNIPVSYADSVRCMLCVASGGMPKILEENVNKSGDDSFVYR